MIESAALNLWQLAFVLGVSPLFAGILQKSKEIIQSKRGPSILQPYRDLRKLFCKDQTLSNRSSWVLTVAPYVVFIVPLVVPGRGSPIRFA